MIDKEICPCTLVLASIEQVKLSANSFSVTQEELQLLLWEFGDIFHVVLGLHPPRLHDHKIPLKDETTFVKVRPYRYPVIQKNELKKLVKEMLLQWSWLKKRWLLKTFY